jgi:D-alanine-D-alanine ligase
MKHVAILCGGQSYEHEVSIITGLQVAEKIDTKLYTFSFIYFDKDNNPFLIKNLKTKKDFKTAKRIPIVFSKNLDSVEIITKGIFQQKINIDVCYLAFHGGTGESGQVQGMCEMLGTPFTSASTEGSIIAMNKSLTKQVLQANNIPTLLSISLFSATYNADKNTNIEKIISEIGLPCIIKPAHLGSSIGIEIAHDKVSLEKFLNVATRLDNEILIEPALKNFTEYNVSLRSSGTKIELSPIEEPKKVDEILSFADKYTKGSKKTGSKSGNKIGGGMEMLDRTLPAKINDQLTQEINSYAVAAYTCARLSGLVRVDFIFHDEKLYCSEINPIPGSMSFYLWEATGEQFQDQITKLIEDALFRYENNIDVVPYETDIVSNFIAN